MFTSQVEAPFWPEEIMEFEADHRAAMEEHAAKAERIREISLRIHRLRKVLGLRAACHEDAAGDMDIEAEIEALRAESNLLQYGPETLEQLERNAEEYYEDHDPKAEPPGPSLRDAAQYAVLEVNPCRFQASHLTEAADFLVTVAFGRFVTVDSPSGKRYEFEDGRCCCPDHVHRQRTCKHMAAAAAVQAFRATAKFRSLGTAGVVRAA